MPEMKIKPKFLLGDKVYLITDIECFERLVVGLLVTPNGIYYQLRYGAEDVSEHFVTEIDSVKPVHKEE